MNENSNRNPLVSVIMPVYNCVKYIDEAVESIVNQIYNNIEIFIIDDCSTDGTREIIESWAKLDARIKPIYKPLNTGIVESLNLGISLSSGEYIARMDGDDVADPRRFGIQIQYFEKNKDLVICGTFGMILGTNQIISKPISNDRCKIRLHFGTPFIHPSIMMDKRLFSEESNFYDPQKFPAEDYHLFVKLSNQGEYANIPAPLIQYRVHDLSVSHVKHELQIKIMNENRNFYNKLRNIYVKAETLDYDNNKLFMYVANWWKMYFFIIVNQTYPLLTFLQESLTYRIDNVVDIMKQQKLPLLTAFYLSYLRRFRTFLLYFS